MCECVSAASFIHIFIHIYTRGNLCFVLFYNSRKLEFAILALISVCVSVCVYDLHWIFSSFFFKVLFVCLSSCSEFSVAACTTRKNKGPAESTGACSIFEFHVQSVTF